VPEPPRSSRARTPPLWRRRTASSRTGRTEDTFRRNLIWSATAHLVLLGGAAAGLGLDTGRDLAPPSAAFIELGMSGPNQTPNLGSASAPPPIPEPVPEPTPPPEPESEPPAPEPPAPEPVPESRPDVVRPTVENRDRMPVPEARARRRAARPERPESGLRGRDAAWADSARLETRRPVDTKSRPSRRAANARSSSRQAEGNTGIGLGGTPGGTRFDQDFEYAFYQRQMIARIQANWQQIPVRGQATVVIGFTIFRDGAISDAEVETSSGQSLLDRAALRAVVLAEPLPRLPDSFPRDRVGVHLLFTYSQQANGSPDGPAPEVP